LYGLETFIIKTWSIIMKRIVCAATIALAFGSSAAMACPAGTHLVGGTNSHHKGGYCTTSASGAKSSASHRAHRTEESAKSHARSTEKSAKSHARSTEKSAKSHTRSAEKHAKKETSHLKNRSSSAAHHASKSATKAEKSAKSHLSSLTHRS